MEKALFVLPMTALAVISISSFTATPATASTYVRLSSWIMSHSKEKCIKFATEVANITGFTVSQEIVASKEYPSSQFYSYSPNGPFAFAVNCDDKTGTAAFAVSGINTERTNQLFSEIIRTFKEVSR
ncbi:hypothetical protein [Synechococcus sp. BIOS-U3-1]|uniref:hypothetical protein n=1 Tax=Synechococcus sp. BIOS-U3-1 TaxID=1400865 RepID=UPI0016461B2F|nr:hypothetical protein [Synechococcus sp. BIOS-U3-1]